MLDNAASDCNDVCMGNIDERGKTMNGWAAPLPEKTDDRCYFFTPEGDRVRLYIVTASGVVSDHGVYTTPQRAITRKRLQDACEIDAPAKFTVHKTPAAPVLHVFAQGMAGVTR